MRPSRPRLLNLLHHNVIELKFGRRNIKRGYPGTRRMLCTLSREVLDSPNGRIALNFRPPTQFNPINQIQKNLITVWDIFMQDFRNINMDECVVIAMIPAKDFWPYFESYLRPMSSKQKTAFQNS